MELPKKLPKGFLFSDLADLFPVIMPSITQLRGYYNLLRSARYKDFYGQLGVSYQDLSRFVRYGTCSQGVMCRLYSYYWLREFNISFPVFDYRANSVLPWNKRTHKCGKLSGKCGKLSGVNQIDEFGVS